MAASRLSADLHTVAADEAPVRNLMLVVERCYLNVRALIATPYASALAATSEDERRLGVTCIDIGGGTATAAAFADGHFVHAATVPVGGHHITMDIAQALQTPLAEAERIKTLYGTVVVAQSDEYETFPYALAGEEEGARGQATKARLAGVIRPRVAGILGMVRERMEKAGVSAFAGERVVLTGGASALVGFGEFAANTLGKPARVARPQAPVGLPQGVSSPAFSTVAGLLAVAASGSGEAPALRSRDGFAGGYLERVGEWLQRSRPVRRIGCIVQFGGELQQPRPAIGPLERAAVRAREICHFRGNRVGREMAVEERVDRESARQIGKAAAQPHEHPVHVHARMPVVAAVEGRMKTPRRERIGVGGHDVIELVRILAVDVRERHVGRLSLIYSQTQSKIGIGVNASAGGNRNRTA